jgi:hypothetical protein
LSLVCAQQLSAQVADNDSATISFETANEFSPVASGIPFNDVRYLEAQGTAYFDQQWLNSTIITTAGKAYKAVPVRIDLLGNKVHFKEFDGREMVVGTPLREVKHEANGKTIRFLNGDLLPNKRKGWFQVLINDSASLVKSFNKFFEEKPSYGGNLLYIKTSETYFVFVGSDEFAVKKVSDLVDVLPAKKAEIEVEIKRLKSSSKEAQIIGVVEYLNTLLKK